MAAYKYYWIFFILILACQPHTPPISPAETAWQQELSLLNDSLVTLPDNFTKTTFLRRYCGSLADVGISGVPKDSPYGDISWEGVNMPRWYDLFKKDSLPANCGIISLFYARLLEHFGYTAYTYSCGWEDSPLVHTFTLIELDEKTILQDATFNSTFLKNNEPYDFFELLKKIKNEDYSNIQEVQDTVMTQNLLLNDTLIYTAILKETCMKEFRQEMQKLQKIPFARSTSSMLRNPCLQQNFEEQIIQRLQDEAKPPHILHFYSQKVYGIYGADTEAIEQQLEKILGK